MVPLIEIKISLSSSNAMYRLADMITLNLKIYERFQKLHGNLCIRVFCLIAFERISLFINRSRFQIRRLGYCHLDNNILKVFKTTKIKISVPIDSKHHLYGSIELPNYHCHRYIIYICTVIHQQTCTWLTLGMACL